jgi:hypothetical protein
MNDLIEAIKNLQSQIRWIKWQEDLTNAEVAKLCDSPKKPKKNVVAWAEKECEKLSQWKIFLIEDLKAAYLHGKDRGIPLDGCLKFAGALELAGDYKQHQAEAWSDLERLRITIEESNTLSPEEEKLRIRRQRGLELWNSSESVQWADVAIDLDGTPETKKAVTQEIKRFALEPKQYIRKAKSGAKRKK